ncbi:MAG: DUF2971 domain-containing protein [Nitrososphaerales archaeon]
MKINSKELTKMKNIVYKYFRINQYLYDTLISNQLYFSSIGQFNDPYDCHIAIFDKISEDDFIVFVENSFKDTETQKKYIDAFRNNPEEFSKQFIEMFKGWLKYLGICCFTKGKENVLLWSHYADSHRGVCLGFDYELMKKKFPQFDAVIYGDEPFYFDIKNPGDSITKTALRKSSNWKYEDEIRFFMERSKNIDFFQEALLEVNFGSRCNKREMMNIQYLISKLNYPNCAFFKASINQSKYTVEFDKSDINVLKKEVLKDSEEIRYAQTVNLEHLLK